MIPILKLQNTRTVWRIILIGFLLASTAHRLPAPISEVPENPTPAPLQTTQPKVRHSTKRKVQENDASVRQPATVEQSKPQPKTTPGRFAGTWVGNISQGVSGNADVTLTINAPGTEIKEQSSVGVFTRRGTSNGSTTTWRGGLFSEVTWAFTPNPDGQTAAVTSKGMFSGNSIATFRKTQSAPASLPATTASTKPADVPIATPVPDRPGFVYNPYEPNKKLILDVRGMASGTRVRIPASGQLFIVP
jgi:hypothetical protein